MHTDKYNVLYLIKMDKYSLEARNPVQVLECYGESPRSGLQVRTRTCVKPALSIGLLLHIQFENG